ncbi:MAG: hypothetical protein ACXVB1_18705, partial [Pseudobdellovibrionaceae bacterium]
MKKIIIAFTIASSFSVMARAETYKNSTGCVVDKQNFNRVEDYNVYKGNLQDGIMYINDGSYAAFQYCNNYKNNKFTIVNKPWGTKITLTCRNQQNGWALTRGRIELDL